MGQESSTNQKNEKGALSFVPSESVLKEIANLCVHYREREMLKGGRKQTVIFYDTPDLRLLNEKKFFYQKDGIFHYSEDISYEFGDTISPKKYKDISVCRPLGIKGSIISNQNIVGYLKKGGETNFGVLIPIETYVIDSLVEISIQTLRNHPLEHPFVVKTFQGQNSKKSRRHSGLHTIDFGVIITPTQNMGKGFNQIKDVLGPVVHQALHPLVVEMAEARRLSL